MKYSELAQKLIPFMPAYGGSGGGSGSGSSSVSLPISSYPEALLRDGSRTLIGNLAVSSGVTIDGVDLGAFYSAINSRLVNAGSGLTGGGALSGDITLNVGGGAGISISSDAVAVNEGFTFTWTAVHQYNARPDMNAGLDVTLAQTVNFGAGAAGSVDLSRTESGVITATSAYFAAGYGYLDAGVFRARGADAALQLFDRSGATSPANWIYYANAGVLAVWNNVYSDVIHFDGRGTMRSPAYASQTTGARVDFSDGSGDFRYLFADEMHVKAFIADLEQALAGGQIIAKSVMQLYRPFTAPAAGGTANVTLRDLPSATGMLGMQNNDYARLRQFTRAGLALTVADCWGTVLPDTTYVRRINSTATGGNFTLTVGANTTAANAHNTSLAFLQASLEALASVGVGNVTVTGVVGNWDVRFIGTLEDTSVAMSLNNFGTGGVISMTAGATDSVTKTQRWALQRSAGADAGAMAAGTVIQPDSLLLDYGVSGNGFYEVNAIDGAAAANSPYFQIVTWATHPRNSTVRFRGGRLTGMGGGGANEYGVFIGDGGMTPGTNRYIRLSNTNFELSNLDIDIYRASVRRIRLDSATPYFALGSPNPTAYLGASGFYVGDSGAGVYRLHLGTVSGSVLTQGLSWDGTNITIKAAGGYFQVDGTQVKLLQSSGSTADPTIVAGSRIGWFTAGLATENAFLSSQLYIPSVGSRTNRLRLTANYIDASTNGYIEFYAVSSANVVTFATVGGGGLQVSEGWLKASAYNPVYAVWNTYGTGDGGAAIYNDNDVYDALMIAGNTSGGGNRRVRLYDELYVANYVQSENSQGFTGRREGTQSIANAAWAAVSCTHDDIDNYAVFDGTNFIPANTGFYVVSGKVTWASNSTGNRQIGIYNATSGVYLYLDTLRGGMTGEVHESISAVLYLTSGHNIRLVCWQDSGAALNISHASDANFYARFGAHKLN